MRFFGPWHRATLTENDEPRERPLETPLSAVGWQHPIGPAVLLQMADNGKAVISSRGQIMLDQRPVVDAQFSFVEGGRSAYQFDIEHGYLPALVSIHAVSPEGRRYPEQRSHLLEAKDVGKNRWFPMHVVRVMYRDKLSEPLSVWDIQVTEIEMDRVTSDDLTVNLPAGTEIMW